MILNDLIVPYLKYVKMYNSSGTYDFTLQVSKALNKYFKNVDVFTIDKTMVYNFINYCMSLNLSNNTINKRVAMLKRLYKYHDLPCSFINIKKLKERFITYGFLDNKSLALFYSIIPKLSLYNQCMMLLFIECGIRVNELIHIKTCNVDLSNRCIFLEITKNNHTRYVYFSKNTKVILSKYILANPKIKNTYLFLSKKTNSVLSRYTVNSISSSIRKKYHIEKLSPHMLRHTLSTKLYNNGANLLFICSIMGHSNPNTTKRYVHNDLSNDLKIFDSYYF